MARTLRLDFNGLVVLKEAQNSLYTHWAQAVWWVADV